MPPTESTESTEVRVRIFSHRIHRIHRTFLLRRASHRLHRFTQIRWVRKIVAEVSLPPQQQLCLGRINNGLNGLNGFLLLGMFNNGLNGLNGFDGCVMLTTD